MCITQFSIDYLGEAHNSIMRMLFRHRVEFVITDRYLPVFTSTEYGPFCGTQHRHSTLRPRLANPKDTDDIVYLLEDKIENFRSYPWENENSVEPVSLPAEATPAPAHKADEWSSERAEKSSATSADSMEASRPYPIDFNPTEWETGGRIAITVQEEDETSNEGYLTFTGHVARFQVMEFTFLKARSKVSDRDAMLKLFAAAHDLAEEYRKKDALEKARRAREAKTKEAAEK